MTLSNPAWRRRPFRTGLRVAWSVVLKRCPPSRPLVVPFDEGRSRIYADMRTAFGRHLYRYGNTDPDLAVVRRILRPGEVFIDGGAHVGMMSIVAARAVGHTGAIFAFEPNPSIRKLLVRNMQLNGFSHVVVSDAALGDHEGEGMFAAMEGDYAPWSHLGVASEDRQAHSILVRITPLAGSIPEVQWSHIGLLKLDVEGAELHALRGAEPLLDAVHPVILMEFVPGHLERFGVDAPDVLSFLTDKGYRLLRPSHDPKLWMPCTFEQAMHPDPERPNLLATVSIERLRERGVEVLESG